MSAALVLVAAPALQAQSVQIDSGASALEIAQSIAVDSSVIIGAEWETLPPTGNPTAKVSGSLTGFPRHGATFGLLTTGDAHFAPLPNDSESTTASNGGLNVRGDTDLDVVVLRIDLNVPTGTNCLMGVDFRFLSEEYPEWVGSLYNDAFILELDESTWTTSGSEIIAPRNFAFDPAGNVISINATGFTSMSAEEAFGTTYDGATPILTAATPIEPGERSLYLSIFDQGDDAFDSAVVVDNLRLGTVGNVATECVPGAQVIDGSRRQAQVRWDGAQVVGGTGHPTATGGAQLQWKQSQPQTNPVTGQLCLSKFNLKGVSSSNPADALTGIALYRGAAGVAAAGGPIVQFPVPLTGSSTCVQGLSAETVGLLRANPSAFHLVATTAGNGSVRGQLQ